MHGLYELIGKGDLWPWLAWSFRYDALLIFSTLMAVIFAVGLVNLGTKHQESIVKKTRGATQFPEGYFTMLSVQLLPLSITGFLIADAYIIGTRVGTLLVVLLTYVLATSADGTFNTKRHMLWLMFWLTVLMLGPFIWAKNPAVSAFIDAHETWIAWSSVVMMILFAIRGQRAVAVALFKHFLDGNYTVKRLSLQVVRFLYFVPQVIQYGLLPSDAKPLTIPFFGYSIGLDPIFLNALIGALGVLIVLITAAVGYIQGSSLRREHKRLETVILAEAGH